MLLNRSVVADDDLHELGDARGIISVDHQPCIYTINSHQARGISYLLMTRIEIPSLWPLELIANDTVYRQVSLQWCP